MTTRYCIYCLPSILLAPHLGPIPHDEFIDIALGFQELLREQASPQTATPAAPSRPAPALGGRTLSRLTSISSLNRRTGQMECGICLLSMGSDVVKPMATPPCGHVSCYDCLLRIVMDAREVGQGRGSCPTCRHSYSEREIRKLFFNTYISR
ncbi:hypothetical protein NADE_006812 [Nannochloris sp. 'desiccata']|nr:hypothetical protein NADE_006812 [Chlorella desiccata (nom. nud.)]